MSNSIASATAIYLGIVLVMSLASFVAYGWDKRRAANGGRRVPESTLQLLAFFGGWPGALIAQRQFRHKTKKLSFSIVFWIVVILHVAIVGTGFVLAVRLLGMDADGPHRSMNAERVW